jgi:hypothetical protein
MDVINRSNYVKILLGNNRWNYKKTKPIFDINEKFLLVAINFC